MFPHSRPILAAVALLPASLFADTIVLINGDHHEATPAPGSRRDTSKVTFGIGYRY